MQAVIESGVTTRVGRRWEIAGLTDMGMHRRKNEDAIAWDAELGLALVADGVGGNNGGEVASSTAIRSIKGDLRTALRTQLLEGRGDSGRMAMVHELVRRANQRILAMAARDPKLHGMGATLAFVLAGQTGVIVANVGDSRVYRMRGGALERLTRDHLLVNEMVARGNMSAHEARNSHARGILSRALGMRGMLEVDLADHESECGDLYLLCSDGLSGALSDDELEQLLRQPGQALRVLAQGAVELAKNNGGRDNISIVLMRLT